MDSFSLCLSLSFWLNKCLCKLAWRGPTSMLKSLTNVRFVLWKGIHTFVCIWGGLFMTIWLFRHFLANNRMYWAGSSPFSSHGCRMRLKFPEQTLGIMKIFRERIKVGENPCQFIVIHFRNNTYIFPPLNCKASLCVWGQGSWVCLDRWSGMNKGWAPGSKFT